MHDLVTKCINMTAMNKTVG